MEGATKVSTSEFADRMVENLERMKQRVSDAALSQQAPRGGRGGRSLSGGVLLLWNFGYLPQPGQLWPVPVILVGLVFLYMAWPRGQSDRWIIPGMVLTLGGMRVPADEHRAERPEPCADLAGLHARDRDFPDAVRASQARVCADGHRDPRHLHLAASPCSSSPSACAARRGARRLRAAMVADDPHHPGNRADRFIFQHPAAE